MASRSLQIMVADNEDVVRQLLDRHLGSRGHAVDQAPNGADCLKLMAKKRYDLVFLDLVMPGVDGETALETIRSRHPDAEVVVVSSHDDDRVIGNILARGARAYLTKPFTEEHIKEIVRQVEREKDGVES